MPTEQTTTTGVPSPALPSADARHRILQVGADDGRIGHRELGQADERGVGDEPRPQCPLGAEPVQWMRVGPGTAMFGDRADDAGQRHLGRHVAVHQQERLAVVSADPDLQSDSARRGVTDRPAHLEPDHLTDEHPVLDHGSRARRFDQRGEVEQLRIDRRRGRRSVRDRDGQRPAGNRPDRGRRGELSRPTGQDARSPAPPARGRAPAPC